jgi:hypothetical protein
VVRLLAVGVHPSAAGLIRTCGWPKWSSPAAERVIASRRCVRDPRLGDEEAAAPPLGALAD